MLKKLLLAFTFACFVAAPLASYATTEAAAPAPDKKVVAEKQPAPAPAKDKKQDNKKQAVEKPAPAPAPAQTDKKHK